MHDKRVQNKLFTLEHVLPLCVESRGCGEMKRRSTVLVTVDTI